MDELGRVQKLLGPEEVCTFAAPGKEFKAGKKTPVLVSVVANCSKNRDELAIFILGNRFESLYIRTIIPIFSDLTYKVSTENPLQFELHYDAVGELHVFEMASPNPLKVLLQGIMKGYNIAMENNLTYSGGLSHQWIKRYRALEEAGAANKPEEVFSTGVPTHSPPPKAVDSNAAWITKMLKTRESEFTTSRNITVFCGTWNVNGQKPGEPLEKWLIPKDFKPDIYCVGFQELDLTAEALLLGDTSRAAPWDQMIQTCLKGAGDYVLLMMRQLVGVLLCVYVKRDILPKVSDVQSGLAAVGIMGMMGNKGGVAIRFNICDTSFCVVNAHLNAHTENLERRNQDYKDISRRILFQTEEEATAYGIFDHDYLIWIGDLNYRIVAPVEAIMQKIQAQEWASLLEFDQLYQQMKASAAFEVFMESPIKFAPTYKYDKNSQNYDSSEKAREPAYCDRVLWRNVGQSETCPVTNLFYTRAELMCSDHRPVCAAFQIKAKTIIPENRSKVYQELLKQLDIMENECMPDATISNNHIRVESVYYMIPSTHQMTIENTGQVMARWNFIPKLDEKRLCKPWINVNPLSGIMLPGERTIIKLTINVDNSTAPSLNNGKDKLEDILILHLDHGKDYFISVSGKYMPSSFGSTLERLILFPHPVRSSQPLEATSEDKLYVPKELWRLIDYLYRRGMEEPSIFAQPGTPEEMEKIRECLDTGASFADFSVHSMAETLVAFLESLSDPVIPFDQFQHAIEASDVYQTCKQLVAAYLSTVHYNTFYYLMSFLRELLTYSAKNGLNATKLAVLFGNVILRPSPELKLMMPPEVLMKKKAAFIHHFLVDDLKQQQQP